MKDNNPYNSQDFAELSKRVDALLDGPDLLIQDTPAGPDDLAQYTPAGLDAEDGKTYQNFSNGYAQTPEAEYRDHGGKKPTRAARAASQTRRKRRKKGGCCGCGCATALLAVIALAVAAVLFVGSFFEMPVSADSIGQRKEKTATILLCGTDKDGTRTDTMMLLYLDGKENRVGLLSLPRDTLTITDSGKRAKLNSAYGRNGCGEEGMEWTLNYVERIIGYRPDGYILVDMELVPKIADLMGGVDFHLDQEIWVRNIDGELLHIPEGDQHLNGEEVLGTLRYRSGYSNADLGRVEVQRRVITECMKQWVNPAKLALLPDALNMVQEESMTDLSVNNFLWIGKTILTGMENMTSQTAEVTVELKNLKERTFRVTNLEVTNKPENLDATIGTVSLSVKLRGDTTIMNSIATRTFFFSSQTRLTSALNLSMSKSTSGR